MTDNIGEKVKFLVENRHYLYLSSLAETLTPDNDEERLLLEAVRWSLETIRRHVAFSIVVKEKNPELDSMLIPKNAPPDDNENELKPVLRLVK
jgi:hypothetical protein